METWDGPKRRRIDKRTGRTVVTEPPYRGFDWKDGYVLRPLGTDELDRPLPHGGATLGGDPYEWVPKDQVDVGD